MNKDILCLYYSRTGHTKFARRRSLPRLTASAWRYATAWTATAPSAGCAADWTPCAAVPARWSRLIRARALQDYRLVILGTPIWAGRCSSIARGFLKRRGLEVQNIAYVVVHGSEELYKDVCDQMDQYVDHPHVADVSLRIGSAGYHFWRDEFIRNVTNYMTAEN